MLSACLTCTHSRKSHFGSVVCTLSGDLHGVMHVCFSFECMGRREAAQAALPSCSASTTATNCPSGHFLDVLR